MNYSMLQVLLVTVIKEKVTGHDGEGSTDINHVDTAHAVLDQASARTTNPLGSNMQLSINSSQDMQ